MNNSTAVAAYEPGPGQVQEQSTGIAVIGGNWSPEEFMKRIEREKAMRQILKDYVKSELKLGYHFDDNIGGQKLAKPMLLQEGARAIAAIFGLFFGEPVLREEQLDDGHFRVRAHIGLFNQAGNQITSGDGLCTSRESKYAFRKAERECPECGAASIIKGRAEYGGGFVCFAKKGGCGEKFKDDDPRIGEQRGGRVDNPDLADVENTVLKMAIKRAKVAAVCDIPTVSEIFAPEGDAPKGSSVPPAVAGGDSRSNSHQPQGKGNGASRVNSSNAQAPSPAPPTQSTVDIVVGLVKKLVDREVPIGDLKELYLPAGVTEFAALTEDQASEIRNDLVDALNAKLKQSN